MKILFVSLNWFGGIQYYSSKALASLGIDCVPFYYNISNSPEFTLESKNKQSLTVQKTSVKSLIKNAFPDLSLLRSVLIKKKSDKKIEEINRDLLQTVENEKPDAVFVVKGEILTSETIQTIRTKYSTPVVAWWLDSPFRFERPYPNLLATLKEYNHIFVCDKHHIPILKETGIHKCSYLPNCVDQTIFKPIELSNAEIKEFGSDISYLGAGFPRRILILENFLKNNRFKIWGTGYKTYCTEEQFNSISPVLTDRIISPLEAAKIYNASKISLNFHRPQMIEASNQKVFEISACESFQLVYKMKSIEEYFEIDSEIVCYTTIEELEDKMKYYLNNESEMAEISKKARKKVLSRHTYEHRMSQAIEIINTI
jgi:spore maturation protein CgeB